MTCFNYYNNEEITNPLSPLVKYYNGLASFIGRKEPQKTITRYDRAAGELDFQ